MTDQYSRIALITGTTSGIGEALARQFVASGHAVVGNGRNAAKLEQLQQELGDAFVGVAGDAADEAVIQALYATCENAFGAQPDIVVPNAGRGLGGSVKDADLSEYDEVLRTNVSGALRLVQIAARQMVERQREAYPQKAADIVFIGSASGRSVSPFSAVYGASKFAIHSLAEGLRREIGPLGVRVSLVEPGIVISGFQAGAGYSDDLVEGFEDKFGPLPNCEETANAIALIVAQAPHVHFSDIVVRPTRQDYP